MIERVVGVVACNNGDILYPCLASLGIFTSTGVRFVFVDNGSTDDTLENFREFIGRYGNGKVIRNETNVGCNQAWNQIYQEAANQGTKFLYLLNSDIQVLRPGWDEEMMEAMGDAHAVVESIGVLGHPGGPMLHLGSACTLYRMAALRGILSDIQALPLCGPWDSITFPGWDGDIDLFNRLRRAQWWPALAKQGVHALHLGGRTERAQDRSEYGSYEGYQMAEHERFLKHWEGTTYEAEWWGRRDEEGCIEKHPDPEIYPWLRLQRRGWS